MRWHAHLSFFRLRTNTAYDRWWKDEKYKQPLITQIKLSVLTLKSQTARRNGLQLRLYLEQYLSLEEENSRQLLKIL
jgi:predicted membrane chloride channel (bestrophin family)